MENTKIMTVVYADDIGLIMQGGITEINTLEGTGRADGDTFLCMEHKRMAVHTSDLRAITGCCKLFINVQEKPGASVVYAVDAYEEITFLDGTMYFTDVFSGEDKKIDIHKQEWDIKTKL